MSMEITDDELRAICTLLSSERLANLHAIAGSDRDAVTLHQQVLMVGACIAPIIALVEIALRNAICERLRATFGTADWLQNPPGQFQWGSEQEKAIKNAVKQAQRAAYAKLSNVDKRALDTLAYPNGVPANASHETRVKARQRQIAVGSGQVVAQLTLYFWKRLFSADYEPTLWKRSLKTVFPNKTLDRADISDALEVIYQARNRVAHHEPLYDARLDRLLDAIDFVSRNFEARHPSDATALCKLIGPFRSTLDASVNDLKKLLDTHRTTGGPPAGGQP